MKTASACSTASRQPAASSRASSVPSSARSASKSAPTPQRAGAAVTLDDRVIVYTQPGGWARPYPWLLSRATAHEYVHVWAAEVADNFAPSNSIAYGPGWLVEGVAEYLSMRMILEAGLAPVDEAENFHEQPPPPEQRHPRRAGRACPSPTPRTTPRPSWPSASSWSGVKLDALDRYYTALGNGVTWPAAFAQAFGISPNQSSTGSSPRRRVRKRS